MRHLRRASRRRLASVEGLDKRAPSSAFATPGACVVYHCFAGDARCAELHTLRLDSNRLGCSGAAALFW